MAHEAHDGAILSRVYTAAYPLILHTSQPLEWCRQPFPSGYIAGMSAGETYSALICIYYYLAMSLYCGSNLDTLEADLSTYTKTAKDFKQDRLHDTLSMLWQMVLNLQGESSRRTVLAGDAFNEYTAMQKYDETNNTFMIASTQMFKVFASVFLGEYEVAADLALAYFDLCNKHLAGQPGCIQMTFYCAYACYISISRRRRSSGVLNKYRRLATRAHKMIRAWTRGGNPNLPHQLAMLEAEKRLAKSKLGVISASRHHKVMKHYEQAIWIAGRSGRIHDQALANERMGNIWIRQGDKDRAKFKFDEAIRLHEDWGAHAKVVELMAQRDEIWGPPSEISVLLPADVPE